jgi:hypothetical protein
MIGKGKFTLEVLLLAAWHWQTFASSAGEFASVVEIDSASSGMKALVYSSRRIRSGGKELSE